MERGGIYSASRRGRCRAVVDGGPGGGGDRDGPYSLPRRTCFMTAPEFIAPSPVHLHMRRQPPLSAPKSYYALGKVLSRRALPGAPTPPGPGAPKRCYQRSCISLAAPKNDDQFTQNVRNKEELTTFCVDIVNRFTLFSNPVVVQVCGVFAAKRA